MKTNIIKTTNFIIFALNQSPGWAEKFKDIKNILRSCVEKKVGEVGPKRGAVDTLPPPSANHQIES